ncbi:hypothetical protein F4802DRAFT_595362 [Xylaria palmicola]|nr:hypothetical protein F4802DRAFT_595362 [Xylaria palmicola]
MCQDIQAVTFGCGHQIKLGWGPSRFCLFKGNGAARFHTVYTFFHRDDKNCTRCKIVQGAREKKQSTKRDAIDEAYASTEDGRKEREAKVWASQAEKAHDELTPARIGQLQKEVKESVAYHLGRDNVTPSARITLLRAITNLPQGFNLKELVEFYACRCTGPSNDPEQLEEGELRKIIRVARQAGLERTLKAGLNSPSRR